MNNLDYFIPSFSDDLKRLKHVTSACRLDMHEPDEQNVKCSVIGDHLDNASGERISVDALERRYQEFVVCLERFVEDESDSKNNHFVKERFNLASLIALARLAVVDVEAHKRALRISCEVGFRSAEKGHNLEKTLIDFEKTL